MWPHLLKTFLHGGFDKMYVALLSGTHEDLAQAELSALIEMKRLRREGRVLIFEADDISKGERAALTHFVGELMAEGDIDTIVEAKIPVEGSFAARGVRVPHGLDMNVPHLEVALGEHILAQNEKAWVDLKNPATTVVAIVTPKDCYLVKKAYDCDKSYTKRHPLHRPFFHPSSMQSRLARVMVNLSKVDTGKRLLDPFCGGGGILLEAASLGALVFGIDADPKMAEGCRKNLTFFGFRGEIQDGLAQEMSRMLKFKFDAIVTDPPYGRNSSIKARGMDSLVLTQMHERLKDNGRLVLNSPRDITDMLEELFEIEFSYSIPVHKSLTRELYVVMKK